MGSRNVLGSARFHNILHYATYIHTFPVNLAIKDAVSKNVLDAKNYTFYWLAHSWKQALKLLPTFIILNSFMLGRRILVRIKPAIS